MHKKHFFTSALCLFLALPSYAKWCSNDSFNFTEDKRKHFALSAAIGSGAALITQNNIYALAAPIALGALKEISDARSSTNCASVQDLAWGVAGAFAGVYGTRWIIGPNFILFHTKF